MRVATLLPSVLTGPGLDSPALWTGNEQPG
jgi:hypothetical protein